MRVLGVTTLLLLAACGDEWRTDAAVIAGLECDYLEACAIQFGDPPPNCTTVKASFEAVPDPCVVYQPDEAASCIQQLNDANAALAGGQSCISYDLPARTACDAALQRVNVGECQEVPVPFAAGDGS